MYKLLIYYCILESYIIIHILFKFFFFFFIVIERDQLDQKRSAVEMLTLSYNVFSSHKLTSD